jgi:hypothetical protein
MCHRLKHVKEKVKERALRKFALKNLFFDLRMAQRPVSCSSCSPDMCMLKFKIERE